MIPLGTGEGQPAFPFWETCRLRSLQEMIELEVKPFLEAQDLLVQWSVILHSNDKRIRGGVNAASRQTVSEQIKPLLGHVERLGFDMCARGVERCLATLARTADPVEIV